MYKRATILCFGLVSSLGLFLSPLGCQTAPPQGQDSGITADDGGQNRDGGQEADAGDGGGARDAGDGGGTEPADSWKNWFAIEWDGTPAERIKYARHMGYQYIAAHGRRGVECREYQRRPDIANLKFYGLNTFYQVMERDGVELIDAQQLGQLTQAQRNFLNQYMAWKSTEPFPYNLAACYYPMEGNAGRFRPQWDMQQQAVIDYLVQQVVDQLAGCHDPSLPFTLAGYMFDESSFKGEFQYLMDGGHANMTTLSHWTGRNSTLLHAGISHEYSTYSEGMVTFFKQLRIAVRARFSDAKWIVEPYWLYQPSGADPLRYTSEWVAQIKGRPDRAELIPDMLSQEGSGTQFVDDSTIFDSGVAITKDMVGIDQPNQVEEDLNRRYAGAAAINGAWYNWFGRYGGTGTMPRFQSITEVYPRLKLIRVVPNWDNLNRVPLTARTWDGGTYHSPSSHIDSQLIASRHWQTQKLFVVFQGDAGVLRLGPGEAVTSAYQVDDFFMETVDGTSELNVSGSQVSLKPGANIPVDPQNGQLKGIGYVFTTSSLTPNLTTDEASALTPASATLHGTVVALGHPATAWFQYTQSQTSYGEQTAAMALSGVGTEPAVITLPGGLTAGTSYWYRLVLHHRGGHSFGAWKQFSTPALAAGLQAHFKLDEGKAGPIYDSSGGGHNGQTFGVNWVQGRTGAAISMDGTPRRYLDFDSNLGITGALTVSAWVFPRSPPQGTGRLVATTYRYDAQTSMVRGWSLGAEFGSADQFSFRLFGSAGQSRRVDVSNFFRDNKDKWTHVAAVFNPGASMGLYVNGMAVATATTMVPSAIGYASGTNLRIGARADVGEDGNQGMWDGFIDEVRIYNRALDAQEVSVLAR